MSGLSKRSSRRRGCCDGLRYLSPHCSSPGPELSSRTEFNVTQFLRSAARIIPAGRMCRDISCAVRRRNEPISARAEKRPTRVPACGAYHDDDDGLNSETAPDRDITARVLISADFQTIAAHNCKRPMTKPGNCLWV